MIFYKQKITILILDALLVAIGLAGYYHIYHKATLPFVIMQQEDSLIITDAPNTVEFNGAVITRMNGLGFGSMEQLEFLCDGLSIGDQAVIEIQQYGRIRAETVTLVPFYSPGYLVVAAIASLSFLILGVLVFVRRSVHDTAAMVFHNAMVLTFLIMTTTWGKLQLEADGMGILLRIVFSAAYVLAGTTFVHFTFVFPRVKWGKYHTVLYPLYTFSLLLSGAMGYAVTLAVTEYSVTWYRIYLILFDVCRVQFALSGIFAILNFIHSYKFSIEEIERRKLRWILLGTFIGPLSFIMLWIVPNTMGAQGLVREEIILLILIIVPVTYSISILKYQLMNIDAIFNRGTVYGLVLFLVLALYMVITGGVATMVGTATAMSSSIASGFAIVIIVLVFDPVRRSIQKMVDRKFFRIQYDYRITQREIIELINETRGMEELTDVLFEKIESNISVERIAFIRYNSNQRTFQILRQSGFPALQSDDLEQYRSELMNDAGIPILDQVVVEAGAKFEPAAQQPFKSLGISASFSLISQDLRPFGLLLLGPKKSQLRYSLEDIDLLNVTLRHVALSMEKIALQHKLIQEEAETLKHKELSELKSLFVSSVSHEFKTPLTSIRMFAELLHSPYQIQDEKRSEYLAIIEGEAERLSRMINSVLDYSKIEKGIKEYSFEILDLNSIVRQVIKLMEYQLKLNKFTFQVSLHEKELLLHADKDAIEEVLINLITNAMKYSKEIREISVITSSDKGDALVTVSDKGIGIPQTELPRIFDPYYRCQDTTSGRISGTGLGLAIVRHVMDAHDASVEVTSIVGEGSAFVLRFKQANENNADFPHGNGGTGS